MTEKGLAKVERGELPITFTRDQVELIKRTVAKGATDDELELFLYQAKRAGLDPLAKQCHAIKRWSAEDKRQVMSIQTGIDGYRLIAERTGLRDGMDPPCWCGEEGVWLDVWTSSDPPVAAKVVVYKKGCTKPYVGIAKYNFYVQKKRDGDPNTFWAKGPDFMLAKCAEALALREAFPQELGGIYTHEEMGQADNIVPIAPASAPVIPPSGAAPRGAEGESPAPHPPDTSGGGGKPVTMESLRQDLQDLLDDVCNRTGNTQKNILEDISRYTGKNGREYKYSDLDAIRYDWQFKKYIAHLEEWIIQDNEDKKKSDKAKQMDSEDVLF